VSADSINKHNAKTNACVNYADNDDETTTSGKHTHRANRCLNKQIIDHDNHQQQTMIMIKHSYILHDDVHTPQGVDRNECNLPMMMRCMCVYPNHVCIYMRSCVTLSCVCVVCETFLFVNIHHEQNNTSIKQQNNINDNSVKQTS
jgi:hypothetical protein